MRLLNLSTIAALPLLALAACEPISEKECRVGDWDEKGFSDGKSGRASSYLERYAEICGAFGISPQRDVYLAARERGLLQYCTPQNAYKIGRNGRRVNAVCAPEAADSMVPAFQKGRQYYRINEDMQSLNDRVNEYEHILATEYSGELTEDQAKEASRIRRNIRDLENDLFRLSLERRRYDGWP